VLEEIDVRRLDICLLEEQLGTISYYVEIEDEKANDQVMFEKMRAENISNPIPTTPVGGGRFFA
jgi:hypothetical protein